MNLQQLRYVIAIAESGSMNSVARSHFISQSSLSVAVKDLEAELGIKIFNRSSRGITLTATGVEFMGYARQVIEQADLLSERFMPGGHVTEQRLSISSQHYAFAVRAFIEFVRAHEADALTYTLRETRTAAILDDVATFRADIGILYLSSYNEVALRRRMEELTLSFTSLFRAAPHVFVRQGHPLAQLGRPVRIQDLAAWPRYTFEQGSGASLYYSEEPLSSLPHARRITVSDRGTMTSLLARYDGFLVSTGVMSDEMFEGIVSLPLETDEIMNVGYITHAQRKLGDAAKAYIALLEDQIVRFGDTSIMPSRQALSHQQHIQLLQHHFPANNNNLL